MKKEIGFWKKEALRIGRIAVPMWVLFAMLAASFAGATSVVVYYATVGSVLQSVTLTPPITVQTYSVSTNGVTAPMSASESLPAGSDYVFYANVINNANRIVNTTMINVVTEDPASSGNYMFPLNVYYLGSASDYNNTNSISCPGTASLHANSIVTTNESSGSFYTILNDLQANTIQSNFYFYTLSGNSILNPSANSISVCNWIGSQSVYISGSKAYYYQFNNPAMQSGSPTTNSITGQLVFPSNTFSYYMPGQQPLYALGLVVPATYNGVAAINTTAIVSARALSSS